MKLTRLRYFIAVAEAKSVVAAAKALRVAQPALSRQLQALEKTVGAPLLERHARGVSLTAAGTALLAHARDAVKSADAALAAARQASASQVVNVSPPDWPHRAESVAAAVADLAKAHPEIEVVYNIAPWTVSVASLRAGIIDVGFNVSPSGYQYDPDITAELLIPEPGVSAVLPARHPLASRKSLAMRELACLPSLIPPRQQVGPLHDQMVAVVRAIGGEDARIADAPLNYAAATQLVALGAGWILTPDSTVMGVAPGTVVRPIDDARMMLGFYALRRTDDVRPSVLALMESLAGVTREN